MATIEGARANGLLRKTGTLTPGKQADMILLRTDMINVMPVNDPVGAIVLGMDVSNVDTVIIAGATVKRDGQMQGVDLQRLHEHAAASRDHVTAAANFARCPLCGPGLRPVLRAE
jgi:cytosine/adenosine deaminase-related metal-dependent hydrolase